MWALYWRTWLSMAILVMLITLLHQVSGVLDWVSNTNYQPSMFWSLVAVLLLIISLLQKNGLVYLVWGWNDRLKSLALEPSLWQQWNRAFICFFIGLAVLSWLVYVTVSTPHWSFYKLYLQPTALVLWPLAYGRFLRYQSLSG